MEVGKCYKSNFNNNIVKVIKKTKEGWEVKVIMTRFRVDFDYTYVINRHDRIRQKEYTKL